MTNRHRNIFSNCKAKYLSFASAPYRFVSSLFHQLFSILEKKREFLNTEMLRIKLPDPQDCAGLVLGTP